MNIKKIIKEEVDDLDFVRNSEEITPQSKWAVNSIGHLKNAYKNSEFELKWNSNDYKTTPEVDIYKDGDHYSRLRAGDGIEAWRVRLESDYREATLICGEECDLSVVYRSIYNTLIDYLNSYGVAGNGKTFKLIRESTDDDFDWVDDIDATMDTCQANEYLSIGDKIHIDVLPYFAEADAEEPVDGINVIASVINKGDNCESIQSENTGNVATLLIHVDEGEYDGFNISWIRTFHRREDFDICSDGKCMYILCGEKDQKNMVITKL